jgi:DNA-binding transcriptional ArsR family regulator
MMVLTARSDGMAGEAKKRGREVAMLLTHPARMRIMAALMGRQLTAKQIGALLPDIPVPSLYRHLQTLEEGGAVTVPEEVRVNGALTRVFAVNPQGSRISVEDTRDDSTAERLGYFTSFLDMLAGRFRDHLSQNPDSDQPEEFHHALMVPLNLSADEYGQFLKALGEFLHSWHALPPSDERRRVIFAHTALPDRNDPPRE